MSAFVRRFGAVALVLGPCVAAAQPHTTGPFTWTAPPGMEVTDLPAGARAQEVQGSSFCLLDVVLPVATTGSPESDLAAEWQELAKLWGLASAAPTPTRHAATGGWTVLEVRHEERHATYGPIAIRLQVWMGGGQRGRAVATTNDAGRCSARAEAFFASMVAEPFVAAAPIAAPGTAVERAALMGTWIKTGGAHQTYGDPVSYGHAGYTTDQYVFAADGTYRFASRTFRSAVSEILVVKERGRWEARGNELRVMPERSIIEAWSKKNGTDANGTLRSTQQRTLQRTTYRVARHYFSGIQEWQLVLQADAPTERDGPFSGNTTYPNAWYYAPPSPNRRTIDTGD